MNPRQALLPALRSLRRRPTFTAAAVISLAVTIACNATVYSVLDGLINPRIGVRDADRVLSFRYFGDRHHRLNEGDIDRAMRAGMRSYEAVTGFQAARANSAVEWTNHSIEVRPIAIRSDFFQTLGVVPLEGRLSAGPDFAEAQSVAVVSDRLAARLSPSDESPVGRVVKVGGVPTTIIGVARRSANYRPLDTDLWRLSPGGTDRVPANLIRLRTGSSVEQANAELGLISARLALTVGEQPKDNRFYVAPLSRQFRATRFHYALVATVLAILLVACANVGNIQFARGLSRAPELAVRSALGASRRHVIGVLTAESAVLAGGGLGLGVILTFWCVGVLRASVPDSVADIVVAPAITWRTGIVAVVAALVCTFIAGVLPAWRVSRLDLRGLLKQSSGTGRHRPSRRIRGLVVAIQLGIAIPIVIAALLLFRSTWRYEQADYRVHRLYGYDPDSLVVARIRLPARSGEAVPISGLAAAITQRIRGLRNVSSTAVMVVQGPTNGQITVADSGGGTREIPAPMWTYRVVSPGYFQTFRLPFDVGTPPSAGLHVVPSVIVDRTTANFLWPREHVLGSLVKFGDARSVAGWNEIVGVLGDQLDQEGRRRRAWSDTLRLNGVYRLMTINDSLRAGRDGVSMTVYARVIGEPSRAAAEVRHALRSMNLPSLPDVQWLRDDMGISDILERSRFVEAVFGAFATLCVALVLLGSYGALSQSITERRREIAMHSVLGASPGQLIQVVLRGSVTLLLLSIAIGLLLTKQSIGWLGSYLGNDDLSGAAFFAAVSATMAAVVTLGALVPAMRAARIQPSEALRAD